MTHCSNVAKLHTAASLNSTEDECHSATQKIPHFVWKLTLYYYVQNSPPLNTMMYTVQGEPSQHHYDLFLLRSILISSF
jgi:hypothetical protein